MKRNQKPIVRTNFKPKKVKGQSLTTHVKKDLLLFSIDSGNVYNDRKRINVTNFPLYIKSCPG